MKVLSSLFFYTLPKEAVGSGNDSITKRYEHSFYRPSYGLGGGPRRAHARPAGRPRYGNSLRRERRLRLPVPAAVLPLPPRGSALRRFGLLLHPRSGRLPFRISRLQLPSCQPRPPRDELCRPAGSVVVVEHERPRELRARQDGRRGERLGPPRVRWPRAAEARKSMLAIGPRPPFSWQCRRT